MVGMTNLNENPIMNLYTNERELNEIEFSVNSLNTILTLINCIYRERFTN